MFGYVTVYKELISEDDYAVFKKYYCGLCRAIGRRCSQSARLGLSYDLTFLAIVLSSVSDETVQCENRPCVAHPLKKRESVNDRAIEYAADMSVILDYLKLRDDWCDEKSIKALLGMLIFYRGMKKAKKRYGDVYGVIKEQLERLSKLEKAQSSDIDECADCFAKILEKLFTPGFISDESERRIFSWFGYNIGRWIYVIDAVNDMEKDYKKGNYNPFNAAFSDDDYDEYVKNVRESKKVTLTFTLENAASAYELSDIRKNNSLLDGLIYDCLKVKQSQILDGNKSQMKGNADEPV